MIDVNSEHIVSFAEAPATLPGRPHISTLHRWRLRGIRGHRLETCLIGGRRYTSSEALERFVAATTAAAAGEPPPVRTPRQRERDIKAAEQRIASKSQTRRSSPRNARAAASFDPADAAASVPDESG